MAGLDSPLGYESNCKSMKQFISTVVIATGLIVLVYGGNFLLWVIAYRHLPQ